MQIADHVAKAGAGGVGGHLSYNMARMGWLSLAGIFLAVVSDTLYGLVGLDGAYIPSHSSRAYKQINWTARARCKAC